MIDIIVISLFCNGWNLITHDGLILDPLRKLYLNICGAIEYNNGDIEWEKPIHKFFYQPVFGCIICMSSVIGSVGYWTLRDFNAYNIKVYPIYIICVAFTNYIFYSATKRIE